MASEMRIPGEWAELTNGQAQFFAGWLTSAKETVFSPTAVELGITPVRSTKYNFQHMGNRGPAKQAFMWRDPHAPNTSCVIMGDNTSNYASETAFALVTAHADGSYSAEGVATGFNYSRSGNLYGRLALMQSEISPEAHLPHIGPYFFQAAAEASANFEETSKVYPDMGDIKIVGAEGGRLARIFRSLSSLCGNLTVNGVPPEQWGYGSQTYDMAKTLLKACVTNAINYPEEDNGQLIPDRNGKASGVMFESDQYGLVVVNRTGAYPDSIALTIIPRPRLDETNVCAERYTVGAAETTFDVAIIPAEDYSPANISGVTNLLDANPKRHDSTVAELQKPENLRLEEKIIQLMAERNQASRQHD